MQHHSANIEIQRIDSAADRRAELRAGLLQSTARISPKFFYDTQGCALYRSDVAHPIAPMESKSEIGMVVHMNSGAGNSLC